MVNRRLNSAFGCQRERSAVKYLIKGFMVGTMNPLMVHSGGFMVSRPGLNDRPVRKTWFASRLLCSHRGW